LSDQIFINTYLLFLTDFDVVLWVLLVSTRDVTTRGAW